MTAEPIMPKATLDHRLAVATELAEAAGRLALGYYGNSARLATTMKGTQDFLTEADGAVEAFLRKEIAKAFPDDGFLGEEGGGSAAERLWIVDPIDGTANFARADPHWCVSIAYVEHGRPMAGVLHAPAHQETFAARRNGGATLNGRPIRVAGTADLKAAAIEIGWSTRIPAADYLALVEQVMRAGASVKRSGSGALGLAWVACGRHDAYLERHINSWDVAAGMVIANEAGATVSDFFAGNGLLRGNPILCAVPAFAGALADAMGLPD